MGAYRRINVASGRPLEKLAHYSRALRAGDTVLQSGTTAIDRQGNVHGIGDVARQVEAIMRIAEWSMGKAGGRLDDVVRSRIYLTDIALTDRAARAHAKYFRDARPVSTLVQVSGLARPEQLVEIEFDAVDGARETARRISSGRAIEAEYAYSRAVRVGDRVFIAGTTALTPRGVVEGPGDMYRQTRATMDTIFGALAEAGGSPADIVYTKTFVTDLGKAADYTRAWLDALGDVRPASTLLGIPALVRPEMLVEIEAEAIIGAACDAPGHLHRAAAREAARLRPGRGRRRPHLRQRLHVDQSGERDRGGGRLGGPVRRGPPGHRVGPGPGGRDAGRRHPATHVHRRRSPRESAPRRGAGVVCPEPSRVARLSDLRPGAARAARRGRGGRAQGRG